MNNDFNSNQNNQNDKDQNQKEEIRFNDWEIGNTFNRGDAWNPHVDYGTYSSDTHSGDTYTDAQSNSNYSEPPVLIDEIKEKKHFSRLGLGFALFTLIGQIAAIIINEIVYATSVQFHQTTLYWNLLTPVALYLFALPVLLIILSGVQSKRPQKRKLGIGRWLLFLIVGFGFMYIGAIIGNGVMDRISEIVGFDYSNSLETLIDEENIWITAIFTVVVAPIGEELVFRKLIIDRTNKYGGVCIVLSALMFGLMHGNFYQFFYCFGIGLILGYIYYSTGRILPCILLHATINFMGSIVPTWLTPLLEKIESLDLTDINALVEFTTNNFIGIICVLVFSLFVYAAMALAIILPITMRKKIKLGSPEVKLPRGRRFAIVAGGAGMIIMFVIYVLEFASALIPY